MTDFGYRRSPVDHRDYLYRSFVQVAKAPRTYQVDRRRPLTPYDQGSVPSCVGWSMATVKTVHERMDKRRTLSFDGHAFYEPIALPGGGAYIRDALERARNIGVPDVKGKLYRISGYAGIPPKDHDAVRHAIHAGRGVLIGFEVTRAWAQGGGREFDSSDDVLGGHAMFVSGYTREGPIGLNSWGPTWSGDGRALLPWDYWDQRVWECWTLLDLND